VTSRNRNLAILAATVALIVLAALVIVPGTPLSKDTKLGLDLRGGTQIVLETQDSATVEADAEATDRTLEVLRGRVDALGVAEPTLARSGEQRIIVELREKVAGVVSDEIVISRATDDPRALARRAVTRRGTRVRKADRRKAGLPLHRRFRRIRVHQPTVSEATRKQREAGADRAAGAGDATRSLRGPTCGARSL